MPSSEERRTMSSLPATEYAPELVHYLPIGSTVISAAFVAVLVSRAIKKGWPAHLTWWTLGVFFYGLGTALESTVTLAGNTIALNKAWYVAGALLGGYPLAQGTVHLLLRPRTAWILTGVTVPFIIVVAALVLASPVDASVLQAHRPSGEILEWRWVRLMTPIINLYAAAFLIGGAVLSAVRFFRQRGAKGRAIGNSFIAVGALLPGIGGSLTKTMDLVEALYIGEFVGIILIWIGYTFCVGAPRPKAEQILDRQSEAAGASSSNGHA